MPDVCSDMHQLQISVYKHSINKLHFKSWSNQLKQSKSRKKGGSRESINQRKHLLLTGCLSLRHSEIFIYAHDLISSPLPPRNASSFKSHNWEASVGRMSSYLNSNDSVKVENRDAKQLTVKLLHPLMFQLTRILIFAFICPSNTISF